MNMRKTNSTLLVVAVLTLVAGFLSADSVSAVTFDSCKLFPWTCVKEPVKTLPITDVKIDPESITIVATTSESNTLVDTSASAVDSVANTVILDTDSTNNDPSDLMIDINDANSLPDSINTNDSNVSDLILDTKDGSVADSVVLTPGTDSDEDSANSPGSSMILDWMSDFENSLAGLGVDLSGETAGSGDAGSAGSSGNSESEANEPAGEDSGVTLTETQFQKLEELLDEYKQELEDRKNEAKKDSESSELMDLLDAKLAAVDKYLDRIEEVKKQVSSEDGESSNTGLYVILGLVIIMLGAGTVGGILWWRKNRAI